MEKKKRLIKYDSEGDKIHFGLSEELGTLGTEAIYPLSVVTAPADGSI